VLSATVDKFVNVFLKSRFDARIRVGYTRTELVDTVEEVEHDLVREALRATGIDHGVEVATMADIPSRGSGLGSSSSVTVGLLYAMWVYQGRLPSRDELAAAACEIEIDRLGRPIGKQDQYAAAHGGLNYITFTSSGITVEDAVTDARIARRFGERIMLFYTGQTRRSSTVLAEQRANIEARRPELRRLAALARDGREALAEGRLDEVGALMHESWLLKRSLASRISNGAIDRMYATARGAGALGGKISGAGGGGFLLLYCPPERQNDVRAALRGHNELEVSLESEGTLVLLHSRRRLTR